MKQALLAAREALKNYSLPIDMGDLELSRAEFGRESVRSELQRRKALALIESALSDDGVEQIAEIAHCGGLIGMSESDALTAIRRLTLPHWKKDRTLAESKATIAAAQKGADRG